MPEALICGAGKIGRGFLGQLLHRSGWILRFLDGSPQVVALLNREKRYRVDIAGRDDLREYIPVAGAFGLDDAAAVRPSFASADLIVSAVGAANIPGLARFIAPLLAARGGKPLDWLICENAEAPAKTIRDTLLATAPDQAVYIKEHLGLVETQILRTGMNADPAVLAVEPLALRMHDWWTLPADAEAFRAGIPKITGLEARPNFGNELKRKLYTFNGLNGPICYLGHQAGFQFMHEAATAPALQNLLHGVQEESAHGLVNEFHFDPAGHCAFQHLAWEKYRDPALQDAIERNARDSARKLSAHERLVGPAALCLKHGRDPVAYAAAIAAAIAYRGSDDAGTRAVAARLQSDGVPAVLKEFCGLAPDSRLASLVIAAWNRGGHHLQSQAN